MNRLLSKTGGMPLHLDDFDFIQDAFKEGLKGAIYPFALRNSGNVILEGCNITFDGATANISEGFVCLGYEVYFVPAHSVATTDLANTSIKEDITFDPNGLDVFADSVSKDTYEVRRAKATVTLNSGDEIILDDPSSVFAQLDSSGLSFAAGWASAGVNPATLLRFHDRVQLHGAIDSGSTNAGAAIDLPVGLRPVRTHNFVVTDSAGTFVRAQLLVNGSISFFTPSGQITYNSGDVLYLDGIDFPLI